MVKKDNIFRQLSDIIPEVTAHGQGTKHVFLNNTQTETCLTQFAYGRFKPGEVCEEHVHPTMEECFYFLSGEGKYTVGETVYNVKPGSFLRIPAGISHRLEATGASNLEFIYFGVATK